MIEMQRLQNKLSKARRLLEKDKALLKDKPDSKSAKFSMLSWEKHISEIEQELRLLQRERNKEVIDFRLAGLRVDNGSIPLDILGSLASNLSTLFLKSVHKIKYGEEALRGVSPEIIEETDLRLSGLSFGSSRLAISGNVSPDLTGDSLLQTALCEVFSALNSESLDQAHTHLHKLGIKASNSLIEVLRTLNKNEMSADIQWDSPMDKTLRWKANLRAVEDKLNQLEIIDLQDTKRLIVNAEVEMLSQRGKIELRDLSSNKTIKCSYPSSTRAFVTNLNLGEKKRFLILEEDFVNKATEAIKTEFTLLGEASEDDPINPEVSSE